MCKRAPQVDLESDLFDRKDFSITIPMQDAVSRDLL